MSNLLDAAALQLYVAGGRGGKTVRAALSQGQVQVSSVSAAAFVGHYPTGSASAKTAMLLLQRVLAT